MNRDLYVAWLNDAYAMEEAIVPVLEGHAKLLKSQADMQAGVQKHIEQTKQHAAKIKECVERNGGSISAVKTGIGTMMGKVQGMMSGMPEDSLIKNALRDYSTEHMEVASYSSLIEAARAVGDSETVRVCEGILQDELTMASWILKQIPMTTRLMLGGDVVTSQQPAGSESAGTAP